MLKIKSSRIADYLANQIYQKKIDYDAVIEKYPAYKDIIDKKLKELNIIPFENE